MYISFSLPCAGDGGEVRPSVAETLPHGGHCGYGPSLRGVEGHESPEVGSWSLWGGNGALGLRWVR